MGHYAQLNQNNIVIRVIPGVNENSSINGEELYSREAGGVWKRTSYNTVAGKHIQGGVPFRKNYAGIGYTYDYERDAFIPPKRYSSFVLNEETCQWEPPVAYPVDPAPEGQIYIWDELNVRWSAIPLNQFKSIFP